MTLSIFTHLSCYSQTFINFLYENSRPNPKYCKDKAQYIVAHKRSYAILFNQLFLFLSFCFNILIGNGQFDINITGVIANTMCFTSTFPMSHFHPEVHRIFVNFINIGFGLRVASLGGEGLHSAWISTSNFPMLMFVATGSLWHFGVNMVIQLIAVNVLYQKPMLDTVINMTPQEFIKSLTVQTNQAILYSTVFVAFTHLLMKEAFNQVTVAEKKKDDFENQKNFLLGFSHELRNLINSLIGNVHLAALEGVSDKAKNLLSNAELCAEMLLHLINNTLDAGKVELGDLEINTSPVKIYDTLERVWGVCSEIIKEKNLRGRLKIQKDIPQVLVMDHYRTTQIFLNLVGNAVKYTDAGEIDITVEWIPDQSVVNEKCFEPYPFNEENETDEGLFEMRQTLSVLNESLMFLNLHHRNVDKSLLKSGNNSKTGILKVTVRDTGIGIPKEEIAKLFKKFTQVSSDPGKKMLGTGLGLFISKELCHRMNGEIKVFSKEGKGSAFTFCLPMEPVVGNNAYLMDRELIRKLILRKNLKAMIVDDQTFNHLILREFLHKFGIEVVELAENGLTALEKYKTRAKIQQESIDIVTMDINMPIMNGKESALKIREFEESKRLKPCLMIMVSANCHESEINDCLNRTGKIKAEAFVKKPATHDEISKILSTYLMKIYSEEEIKMLNSK